MNMAGMPAMPSAAMQQMGDANGMPGPAFGMNHPQEDARSLLPTYIYDWLRKTGKGKLASAMLSEPDHGIKLKQKQSPNRQVNGAGKVPDIKDLPEAQVMDDAAETSFLEDWWVMFHDMYSLSHGRDKGSQGANMYWAQVNFQRKSAMSSNQAVINASVNNPNVYRQMMQNGAQAGMTNPRLQQIRNGPQPGGMLQNNYAMNMRNMQQMGQAPMQRGGSGMDVNNQGQSPMSGENAPSPKRQRLEGGAQINRPGSDPNAATLSQFKYSQGMHASAQGKVHELQGINQMAGMPQGSPMAGGDMGVEGFGGFGGGAPGMSRSVSGPAPQQGQQAGGALADYQMQLMLLEQQNKKRLMMARQEHENSVPGTRPDGGPGGPHTPLGAAGFGNMNAQRNGQSPSNADQVKRGTPKIGQNSPLPDGMAGSRVSPAPGNFEAHGVQQGMGGQFMGQPQMGPNGPMMRPPSSNPLVNPQMYNGVPMNAQSMEMMRQNSRMPNGAPWPGQQMMPGQGQMQQQQPSDQQRSNMPPPQGPMPNASNANKPSPPQQQQSNGGNPPTPSQANKATPAAKKKKEDTKKKPAKKGATTGQTPSADADAPATPTTPMHPSSFSGQPQKGPQGVQQPAGPNQQPNQGPQAPPPGQGTQPGPGQQPAMPTGQPGGDGEHDMNAPFGNIADQGNEIGFNIGPFQPMGDDALLADFDFDAFIVDTDNSANWGMDDDGGFALNGGDGLDAGTGGA